MSIIGRLWRRAPAWRLSVVTAIICTALAAMFPPPLPHFGNWHSSQQTGTVTAAQPAAVTPSSAPAAHFAQLPDPAPIDTSSVEVPYNAADRSGVIPFAGRQVPLPAGIWKDLLIARLGGAVPGQMQVLGRIENGHLTGLLQIDAPSPASGAAGPLATPEACHADNTIMREIAPESASQSPLAHECWLLIDSHMTASANRAKLDDIMRRALVRVDQLGADIPDHMLMLLYIRSSETGWLRTQLLLPADRDVTVSATRRIEAWCRRFVAELNSGYDGKLGALRAVVGRDPT